MAAKVNPANIAIVLVQPNISENIGAAARAMCNMGLRRLILVNPPRCDLSRVCKMATHAALDVVEEMEVYAGLPEALREALLPVVEQIGALTAGIKEYDAKIEAVSEERYPAVEVLRSVPGVGPITALAYVLTVESPGRFESGRQVGAYFGLVPRRAPALMLASGSQSLPSGRVPSRKRALVARF